MRRRQAFEAFVMRLMSASIAATALMTAVRAPISPRMAAEVGKHGKTVCAALAILLKRFCDPKPDEGYLREGPVAVAWFEIEGDGEDPDVREPRALRQRVVNDVISRLLGELGGGK